MKRRVRPVDPATAPPARLVDFDPADWLPLVDPSDYHPDDWRNIRNHVPYGEPRFSFDNWRRQEAWNLWTRARYDWCEQYGWPGGLTVLDLMQEQARMTFNGVGRRRPHDEWRSDD